MTLEFRAAGPGDLEAILAIEQASFSIPWTRIALDPELEPDGRHQPVIALIDGKAVGFALVWVIADERHLVNFAVDPSFRRQGIGRQMLEGVIGRARDEGATMVTLEVRATNEAARGLYREAGFMEIALRPRYYPDTLEDAVIMLLPLDGGPGK